jgi:hypothetical protein
MVERMAEAWSGRPTTDRAEITALGCADMSGAMVASMSVRRPARARLRMRAIGTAYSETAAAVESRRRPEAEKKAAMAAAELGLVDPRFGG